ncbi:MAG: adenylate/guanylate cyclase domain-containing protein [Myxococcaceae bacterium]|nr:adenylate/guanylate cyclase domain-containing protein [Myxococcaceae bacterium]
MSDGVAELLHHESGEREVAVQRLRTIAWLLAGSGAVAASVLWQSAMWPALIQVSWGVVCVGIALQAWLLRRWPVLGVALSAIDAGLVTLNTMAFREVLLSERPEATTHQLFGSALGFALVGSTGALRFTPWLSAALATWACGCYVLTLGMFGGIDPGIIPDIVLFTVLGALTTYAAWRQRYLIQRGLERDALARYLPTPAVERIAQNPADQQLGGTLVEATVVFCDLRGFTTLASKLPPAGVVATVNEWFKEAVAETLANGGVVDKFVGDALLAVFPGGDGPARAVRCALGWRKRLAELNVRRAARGEGPLEVGTGAHVGQLVAGNVGSPERLEYTHIGDVVNVAARVQDLTKKYGEPLLVTADVWQAAAVEGLVARDVGEVKVRGRDAPLRLMGIG